MSYTIGIDLGGSHVKTVVVSSDGETRAHEIADMARNTHTRA